MSIGSLWPLVVLYVLVCHFDYLRFTKDLKPQDINLSFLSGKGELNNLELDPNFLNEILELPPWVEFQSAVCDNIKAKVIVNVTCSITGIHIIYAYKCVTGAAIINHVSTDYTWPISLI